MPEFLELLPPSRALKKLLVNLPDIKMPVERIMTVNSLNRVIAETINSPENSPSFDRSTVDGYAVLASDTYGASESQPAYLKIAGEIKMGARASIPISPGTCAAIHTGGMLPDGTDAVVMIEQTQLVTEKEVEIFKACAIGENVIRTGEDIQTGNVIFLPGVVVTPAVLGSLLAVGLTEIDVFSKPRVAILSSGDEVVAPDCVPEPGQVRDINSYTLSALVEGEGCVAERYGVQPDQFDVMADSLSKALDACDAVVITAGSSASTRDLTAAVIQSMGSPGVLVHGVNIKPGKPTILAVCRGKPVIGLPGNPVSALVIAGQFLRPVLRKLCGKSETLAPHSTSAVLSINLSSASGREDWFPVQLVDRDGLLHADPIFFKSNLIFNLAYADGMIVIPEDSNGLAAGSVVTVFPV